MQRWKGPKRDSSATSLLNCIAKGANLGLHQVRGDGEAHCVLRQVARFPIETHIVAVVVRAQSGSVDDGSQLRSEINVFGFVARRVSVGDVGCSQLLARSELVHEAFEAIARFGEHRLVFSTLRASVKLLKALSGWQSCDTPADNFPS